MNDKQSHYPTLIRVEQLEETINSLKLTVVLPGWNADESIVLHNPSIEADVLDFIKYELSTEGVCRLFVEAKLNTEFANELDIKAFKPMKNKVTS